MELKRHVNASSTKVYYLWAFAVLSSALTYYLLMRTQLPWPGYLLAFEHGPLTHLNDITQGAYPSFAFTLGMGFVSIALFIQNKVRAVKSILGIWLIGLAHEVTLGTFSSLDVLAGTLGMLIPLGLIGVSSFPLRSHLANPPAAKERLKLTGLMLVSATLATGTSAYEPYDSDYCSEYDVNGICIKQSTLSQPVYLSYADLRSAVKMSEPRDLNSVSRIYLYNDLLFVNEKNQGIHIIDNSDASNPVRTGFIEIPGNTEISIRDNNLYADSYIDLVTIDLSDMQNITEIARQVDIFPYNVRQNIPNDVRLPYGIDKERGVVVGHR